MTKEQYESHRREAFLTAKEKQREETLNRKCGHALTQPQVRNLARKHEAAAGAGDYRTMARIEYRLGQVCLRKEADCMRRGEYGSFKNVERST